MLTREKDRGSEVNRKSFYCFGKRAIITFFTRSAFQKIVLPANKSSSVTYRRTNKIHAKLRNPELRLKESLPYYNLDFWRAFHSRLENPKALGKCLEIPTGLVKCSYTIFR